MIFRIRHSSFLPGVPILIVRLESDRASLHFRHFFSPRTTFDVDLMERFIVFCETCERTWSTANAFTVYEQQSIESRPCPACWAYTLSCREPEAPKSLSLRPRLAAAS
jgi:hypothetical protein